MAMICGMLGLMREGRGVWREMGLGGGPKRGGGEGGRGSAREVSKSGPVGLVRVRVVDARRVVGVRVDVPGVSRSVRVSPHVAALPSCGPSALCAAGPGVPSGASIATLRHGSRVRGRRRAVAGLDRVGDVARGADDDDGWGAILTGVGNETEPLDHSSWSWGGGGTCVDPPDKPLEIIFP